MIAKLLGDALIIDENKNCSAGEIQESSYAKHQVKQSFFSDFIFQPSLSLNEENPEESNVTTPSARSPNVDRSREFCQLAKVISQKCVDRTGAQQEHYPDGDADTQQDAVQLVDPDEVVDGADLGFRRNDVGHDDGSQTSSLDQNNQERDRKNEFPNKMKM